jgi:hypothetical protein
MKKQRSGGWETVFAFLSLIPTPLLLFLAPSNRLYMRNRAQLNHQLEVLLPFVELFVVVLAVGSVLYLLSRYAPVRYALFAYYLAGPFFLTFQFMHGATETLPFLSWLTYTERGGLTLLLVFTAAVVILGWKLRPRSVTLPLAAFGILLMLGEAWTFRPAFRNRPVEAALLNEDAAMAAADESLPNVYHLLLDGFQSDMLALYLSAELEESLGGFTFFPNNEAVYHMTSTSLASMFGGKRYAYDQAKWEYLEASLNGESSLFRRLSEGGYVTTAYIPALQETRIEAAHYLVRQEDHVRESLVAMNTSAFVRLWIFGQVPAGLREWFSAGGLELGPDETDRKRMEEGRFLPYSGPAVSAVSFARWMLEEKGRPAGGRYSFIHLLMPHPPYVLRGDCSYERSVTKTDMPEQLQCTMRLLLEFLEVLHELDRFDGSLIVINGDHGGTYRVKNKILVESRSRSLRALLLVKPVGRRRLDGLQISEVQSSILDISPTILDCLGLEVDDGAEGRALAGPASCRAPEGEPVR